MQSKSNMASNFGCYIPVPRQNVAVGSNPCGSGFGAGWGGHKREIIAYDECGRNLDSGLFLNEVNSVDSPSILDLFNEDLSPGESDEWNSCSPPSPGSFVNAPLVNENAAEDNDFDISDFPDDFPDSQIEESVLNPYIVSDISAENGSISHPLLVAADHSQSSTCQPSLTLPPQQPPVVYIVLPCSVAASPTPMVATEAADQRRRRRKMSHSGVIMDDEETGIYMQAPEKETGWVEEQKQSTEDDIMDASFWDVLCSDEASSEQPHLTQDGIPWEGDPLSLEFDAEVRDWRLEKKRALNREAAHRYRRKQKASQDEHQTAYQRALTTMRRAQHSYMKRRDSLQVMRSLVLDLLVV